MSIPVENYQFLQEPDEIRLLHLQSGSKDIIQCTLVHARLSKKPSYEALSYMWGTEENSKEVEIDGHVRVVRENLWQALRHLRLENTTRVLWIDALCINQQDVNERNHQVTQMSQIYEVASKVCIWFGTWDEIGELEFHSQVKNPAPTSVVPSCFEDLCFREYWDRLWIIQEISLAPRAEIYCGHISTDLDKFFVELQRYMGGLKDKSSPFTNRRMRLKVCNAIKVMRRRRERLNRFISRRPVVPLPLCYLIREFQKAKCADSRDRVFGLRSLAHSCCQQAVPVDYSSSAHTLCNKILDHDHRHHDQAETNRDDRFFKSLYNVRHSHELHRCLMEGSLQTVDDNPFVFNLDIENGSADLPLRWRGKGILPGWDVCPLVLPLWTSLVLSESELVPVQPRLLQGSSDNVGQHSWDFKDLEALAQIVKFDFKKLSLSEREIMQALDLVHNSMGQLEIENAADAPLEDGAQVSSLTEYENQGFTHIHQLADAITETLNRSGTQKCVKFFISTILNVGIFGLAPSQTRFGDIICGFNSQIYHRDRIDKSSVVAVVREHDLGRFFIGRAIIWSKSIDFDTKKHWPDERAEFPISIPDLQLLTRISRYSSTAEDDIIVYKKGRYRRSEQVG